MSLRKKMKTSEVAARFPRRHLHRQIGFRSDDATAPVKSTRDRVVVAAPRSPESVIHWDRSSADPERS